VPSFLRLIVQTVGAIAFGEGALCKNADFVHTFLSKTEQLLPKMCCTPQKRM
jgi:hypothetical protein